MDAPTSARRPFLTARWTNLLLANYAVPDELLAPHVPTGLELDRYEGRAYVSLVAFDFRDTRVFGIPWPGYRNFPELNLRCYVRQGAERGVCFLREFVPLRLVAWLARLTYNEPYAVLRMVSAVSDAPDAVTIEHRLRSHGREHTLCATAAKPAVRPDNGSVEHFFKEHRWGFGRTRRGHATRFEVLHPVWDVYPVRDYRIDIDWDSLYGAEWATMQKAEPESVIVAGGSAIAVYPRGRCTA